MHKKTKDQIWQNIVQPLADAMKAVDINENTVMKRYSEIMFSETASEATILHAIEVWLGILGLKAPQKIEVNETHKIKIKKKK